MKIQVQYTDPTNIIQMIKTGVASGQAPDVATQLPGSAQFQLWKAGQLLDFKPYIDADAEWQGWVKGWDKVPGEPVSRRRPHLRGQCQPRPDAGLVLEGRSGQGRL